MVLAALPSSGSEALTLTKETALVRSAVLYADTIDLISPTGSLLSSIDGLQDMDALSMSAYVASLMDADLNDAAGRQLAPEELTGLRGLMETALLSDAEVRERYQEHAEAMFALLAQLRPTLTEGARQMRAAMGPVLASSGLEELRHAYERGVVTLTPLGELRTLDPEQMMLAFVEALRAAVASSSTRLLLDGSVAGLIEELVSSGDVRPSALMRRHAREAAVGAGLISRLPAFPEVPLDELLDMRADLAEPLSRYRRAASTMGAALELDALSRESSAEIDDLWRSSVAPTIEELRQELGHHSLVREVARSATTDIKTIITGLSGPAVVVGFKDVLDLDAWSIAAAAFLTGGTAAHHLAKAALERGTAHRSVRRNDLFYLVALNERITPK
jgi:hypothetical protein